MFAHSVTLTSPEPNISTQTSFTHSPRSPHLLNQPLRMLTHRLSSKNVKISIPKLSHRLKEQMPLSTTSPLLTQTEPQTNHNHLHLAEPAVDQSKTSLILRTRNKSSATMKNVRNQANQARLNEGHKKMPVLRKATRDVTQLFSNKMIKSTTQGKLLDTARSNGGKQRLPAAVQEWFELCGQRAPESETANHWRSLCSVQKVKRHQPL